jgi:hypothetical protein
MHMKMGVNGMNKHVMKQHWEDTLRFCSISLTSYPLSSPHLLLFLSSLSHLSTCRYAHENGCPWNHETIKAAKEFNSESCLKYALEHGCPVSEENN